MKTNAISSSIEAIRLSSSTQAELCDLSKSASDDEVNLDSFIEDARKKEPIKYCNVFKDAKALWGKPLEDLPIKVVPVAKSTAIAREEDFIQKPTSRGFFRLAQDFASTMMVVGHQKYSFVDEISIKLKHQGIVLQGLNLVDMASKERKLEYWHKKQEIAVEYGITKAERKTIRRHEKIEEMGLGFGGKMTSKVAKSKTAAYFAKNNLTIRGNVFKLTHAACPKNIYEIMPRFGYRKGAHVGVRVTQFSITTILSILGYALIPATFGVSKVVCDHLRTVITLSGEVITHKIAGAEKEKCIVHTGLRGVQLEVPNLVPLVGDVVNIGEGMAFGVAASGIVSTTLADMVLAHFSERYTSTLNLDDLGDARCIAELNNRIDYLSRFLLPYGQFLLLKESNVSVRKGLKRVLKENFTLLRDLERKKVSSLNYYRLALAAEKLPASHLEQIRLACEKALPETRINTHRTVKKCLARLMAKDLGQKPKYSKVAPDSDWTNLIAVT